MTPLLIFCTGENDRVSKDEMTYFRNKNFPPAKKRGLLSAKPKFIIILKFIIKIKKCIKVHHIR